MPPTPLYPVVLRVEGRPCLVVGGGPVAARKVGDLVACGALVTVVAPEIDETIVSLAAPEARGSVTLERRPYRGGEAAGYRLVVTATGIGEIDGRAAADAEAAGIWVNSADDVDRCTFFLPSVHRQGAVTVAVSTGGASPALAAWLRRQIAGSLDLDLVALARLLEDGRAALRAAGRPTSSVDWTGLLDDGLPGLVAEGRLEEARRVVEAAVAAAQGPPRD